MNGDRITKEKINLKTDEFVSNTIKLANKKVSERIKSCIRVIGIVILVVILMLGYLFLKVILANFVLNYDLSSRGEGINIENLYGLNFDKEILVKKQTIAEENYYLINDLEFNNNKYSVKFRNDFKNMETICADERENNSCSFYRSTSNRSKYDELFIFYVVDTAINQFKNDCSLEFGDTEKYCENILKKLKIKNDVELLKYAKNVDCENNIFTDSIKEMKDNYIVLSFIRGYFHNESEVIESKIITGDYEGYMLTTIFTGFDNQEVLQKTVYILKNDVVYTLRFIGNDYTDEYIEDLLSTLVIE